MSTTIHDERDDLQALLSLYGCGPIPLTGSDEALYERHLTFDDVVAVEDAGPRVRYEAFARSVRDVLSQRWIATGKTYDRRNPKRVYYLSLEYLIGRSLSNNIVSLLLEEHVARRAEARHLDWRNLLESEPDAGLGNGGLGRLAACFPDSMATLALRQAEPDSRIDSIVTPREGRESTMMLDFTSSPWASRQAPADRHPRHAPGSAAASSVTPFSTSAPPGAGVRAPWRDCRRRSCRTSADGRSWCCRGRATGTPRWRSA